MAQVRVSTFLENEMASLRVLCLPFAGGETRSLVDDWVRAIQDKTLSVEILGVDYSWTNERPVTVEEWADAIISSLCGQFFDKHYVLFGHSLGALAVVALTTRLQERKILMPAHIFLSAAKAPQQAIIYDKETIQDDAAKLTLLESWGATDSALLADHGRRRRVLDKLTGDLLLHNGFIEYLGHQAKPFEFATSVSCTIYGGQDDSSADPTALEGWKHFLPEAETQVFSGDHFYLMHPNTQPLFLDSFLTSLEQLHVRLTLSSRALINTWNSQTASYPSDKCLHELFVDAVQRTPNATAVYYHGTTLTFQQVDTRSDQLAAYLYSVGVRPNTITGIFMEHCIEFVIAYIAALKAGGAYMPLEIVYPPDLLTRVFEESKPIIILTKQVFRNRLPSWQLTLEMDAIDNRLDSIPPLPADRLRTHPDDLAYVVMSSGTTGVPKGICCPHRGAVHSYDWRLVHTPYQSDDRVACHVFFVWELLRPMLGNIPLYIIPDDVIYDPLRLVDYMAQHHITRVLFTPSLLQLILDTVPKATLETAWATLRLVWLCGEVVTIELQERFVALFPHCALFNLYSVSECHDVSAIDLAKDRSLTSTTRKYASCGRVMPNVKAYILDDAYEPVPIGVPGELYIGGPCLAIGYLNRPEQSAQRFLRLPSTQERVYKTGDRARFLPNGDLELIGRCDFMVKIRGYSVVLGAVESALAQHPLVSTAVVLTEGNEGEDKRLVAYIVPNQWDVVPSIATLRTFLQDKLPHYAIPSIFIQLDSLPIHSASGKLDRKKMPSIQDSIKLRGFSIEHENGNRNELETETEKALSNVWKELLRLDTNEVVDRSSHFFDMGGHSLLATRLISKISEVFDGIQMALADVLSFPRLCEIAARIDCLRDGTQPISSSDDVSLPLEVELDASIYPAATRKGGYSRYRVEMMSKPPRTVLLTGCTGFLGIHILSTLSKEKDVIVFCLVRAATEEEGWNRIRQTLTKYHLLPTNEHWEEHVVVVTGDLSQPLLGVGKENFKMLASEVDAIIHNGAEVHLMKPYSALKAANVLGTQEVLRLAVTNGLMKTRVKPVHYISTNGVFPAQYPSQRYKETDDLTDCWKGLENGYAQSKWVAEQLCRVAAQRGLPVSILRPGNMAPSSRTGCWNPSDFIYLLLTGCKELNAIPLDNDWQFDLTPVDYAAQAIVYFSTLHPVHALGQTLHIQNPHLPINGQLFLQQWSNTLNNQKVSKVSLEEWTQMLKTAASPDTASIEIKMLAAAFESFEEYLKSDKIFDCTIATGFLEAANLQCPQVNQELLKVFRGVKENLKSDKVVDGTISANLQYP